MNKLLIVGCGELGSRFLQASISINQFSIIEIVEPNKLAVDIAKKRTEEVINKNNFCKINYYINISEISETGNLAIIATQADTRDKVFEDVVRLGYKYIILEKIVTQSINQYQNMQHIASKNDVKVWVNCKTRCYPIWKYIKSKITKDDNTNMHSIGGNHGLCTNGLHTIDLFIFLTNSSDLNIDFIKMDVTIHKTKRNKYDTSGIISYKNINNSILLDYNINNLQMPIEIITTNNFKWIVDNAARQAFEISTLNSQNIKEIPYDGDLSVSFMSRAFILEILHQKTCELPTLDDCFLAHKIMYDTMLPHFNKYLDKNILLCPIT
jgi:predicted dehydrogenase